MPLLKGSGIFLTQEVTVQRARQILVKRGEKLTDKQINDILNMLRFICNKAIDGAVEREIDDAN